MEMVTCPFCNNSFPLDEVIRSQILKEFQENKDKEIEEKNRRILELENTMRMKEMEIKENYERQYQKMIKDKEYELRDKIRKELYPELEINKKRIEELQESLRENKEREINEKMSYEKKIFDLEQEKMEKELEFQRKLQNEILRIRNEEESKVKDEFSIKEKEYQETIESLKKKVEELSSGFQNEANQLVGEAQEIAIEEKLRYNFPEDIIEPVPKGVTGADIIQSVMYNNQTAGKIVWESKRTKQWKDDWVEKLKDDKMKSGSDLGVIVTKTMPKDSRGITIIDGIIVSEYSYLIPIATLLRLNLINIKKVKISQSDRGMKESLLYDYITSNEFRNRVQSLLDSIKYAKEDLEKEKIALNKIWAKRNMDLEKAVINLAQIYGTMQGMAGNSLPDIPSLIAIEADNSNQKKLPDE